MCQYKSQWSNECMIRYQNKPYMCTEQHSKNIKCNERENQEHRRTQER